MSKRACTHPYTGVVVCSIQRFVELLWKTTIGKRKGSTQTSTLTPIQKKSAAQSACESICEGVCA